MHRGKQPLSAYSTYRGWPRYRARPLKRGSTVLTTADEPAMPAPITARDLDRAIETILDIATIPSMAHEGLVGFTAGLRRGRWYPDENTGGNDWPAAEVFVDIEEIMALQPRDRVGNLKECVVAARAFYDMLIADPDEHPVDVAAWHRRRRALDLEEEPSPCSSLSSVRHISSARSDAVDSVDAVDESMEQQDRTAEAAVLCEMAEALCDAAGRLPRRSEWREAFVGIRRAMLDSAGEAPSLKSA
jgi:hypothetical protein